MKAPLLDSSPHDAYVDVERDYNDGKFFDPGKQSGSQALVFAGICRCVRSDDSCMPVLLGLVLINTFVCRLTTIDEDQDNSLFIITDIVTTSMLGVEICIRLFAYAKRFFRSGWNWFDIVVFAASLASFFVVEASVHPAAVITKAAILGVRYFVQLCRLVVLIKRQQDRRKALQVSAATPVVFSADDPSLESAVETTGASGAITFQSSLSRKHTAEDSTSFSSLSFSHSHSHSHSNIPSSSSSSHSRGSSREVPTHSTTVVVATSTVVQGGEAHTQTTTQAAAVIITTSSTHGSERDSVTLVRKLSSSSSSSSLASPSPSHSPSQSPQQTQRTVLHPRAKPHPHTHTGPSTDTHTLAHSKSTPVVSNSDNGSTTNESAASRRSHTNLHPRGSEHLEASSPILLNSGGVSSGGLQYHHKHSSSGSQLALEVPGSHGVIRTPASPRTSGRGIVRAPPPQDGDDEPERRGSIVPVHGYMGVFEEYDAI